MPLAFFCFFRNIPDRGVKKLVSSSQLWALYTLHFILILWAALEGFWTVPINATIALIGGSTLTALGLIIAILGVLEFRSFKRMSGLDTSRLLTTGIYRCSRNPQNLGLFLIFLGVSLMGRSILAFLLTAVFIVEFHAYVVKLEEPYLERIFGEDYRRYKEETPRYLGILLPEGLGFWRWVNLTFPVLSLSKSFLLYFLIYNC